jgi:AAA-like domain
MLDAELSWEQVKSIADQVVWQNSNKHLTDREVTVLHGAWQGRTYEAIALEMNLSADYIHKDVGSTLWQKLSGALNEKVGKQNFRQALQRYSLLNTTAPLLATNRFPTGAIAADSPLYVLRNPIEADCERELLNPGALVRIKSPQMTGKTSLLNWLLDKMQQHQYQTVRINLRRADKKIFQDIDMLLRWLSANITKQLGRELSLDDYWDAQIGSKVSCTSFLQDGILESLTDGLLLAIDDIDVIFAYPDVAEDFLSLLREWHEEANFTPSWQKLRLAVAHTTEVYIALDLNQSPFNVGLPVQLPGFQKQQVLDLATLHGWSAVEAIDQVLELVGGHPYLMQMALYHLGQQQLPLADFLATAATYNGIYSNHLRHYLANLQAQPDLLTAMQEVVRSDRPVQLAWSQLHRLNGMGLISLAGNLVQPSCELYRSYFRLYLT